jgi:antitoxin YefM
MPTHREPAFPRNLDLQQDAVVEGRDALRVTRNGGSFMRLSERDDEGWRETVHLLASPRNATRLFQAIR